MSLRTPKKRTNAYGLVIGRIQSGKQRTHRNRSCRAIDVTEHPYDTIIILSGLIDDLRMQTQDRFEKVLNSYTEPMLKLSRS